MDLLLKALSLDGIILGICVLVGLGALFLFFWSLWNRFEHNYIKKAFQVEDAKAAEATKTKETAEAVEATTPDSSEQEEKKGINILCF